MSLLLLVLPSLAQEAPLDDPRALLADRPDAALTVFEARLADAPDDAAAARGRAEALALLGRHADAQRAWEDAARLDPMDPWAPLGTCGALAEQGPHERARACLDALRPHDDPSYGSVRDALSARVHRDASQGLLATGNRDAARREAQEALTIERSPWSLMALGAVLLRDQEGRLALDAYTDAAALAEDASGESGAAVDARIGRAAALVELGRDDEAIRELRDLVARLTAEDASRVTRALRATLALREALALHGRGDLDGARARLDAADAEVGADVDLLCARATVEIAAGNGSAAWTAASAANAQAPTSWSRQVLVGAARASGSSDAAAAILERLAAVDAEAVPERDAARLDTRLGAAREARGGRQARLLRAVERDVENGTIRSRDAWSQLGYTLLAAGRPRRALRAFDAVLAADPADEDAGVARAHALLALGRAGAAERTLVRARTQAPEDTAGASVSLRARAVSTSEASRRRAEADLVRTEIELVRGRPGAAAELAARIDRDAARWVAVGADALDARIARMRGPAAAATVAGLARGRPGVGTDLFALVTPVRMSVPAGAVRIAAEAAPTLLSDADGNDAGSSLSAGIDTSPLAAVVLGARAGISPIGFDGGVYPTWGARLAWRVTPAFSLSVETGRAPRTDSRAAWAGVVYAPTGQLYGRASQVWGGLEASSGTSHGDVGLLVRGGYLEGIGVEPNPTAEATWWLGRRTSVGPVALRAGADGVAMGFVRSDAGFVPTDAGTFSPPLFATAIARLDADVGGARWGVCAGAGVGPRYRVPDGQALDAGAFSVLVTGHAGAALALPGRWRLVADVRGERASTDWQQLSIVTQAAWGARPPFATPAAAPLGAPGFSLPPEGALCAPRGDT